jgi:hypothetical protein
MKLNTKKEIPDYEMKKTMHKDFPSLQVSFPFGSDKNSILIEERGVILEITSFKNYITILQKANFKSIIFIILMFFCILCAFFLKDIVMRDFIVPNFFTFIESMKYYLEGKYFPIDTVCLCVIIIFLVTIITLVYSKIYKSIKAKEAELLAEKIKKTFQS